MRYIPNQDLHIHSQLSPCSGHPEQTTERILRHGVEHGLRHLCLTDHVWDSAVPGGTFYSNPGPGTFRWFDLAYNRKALPLPQAEGVTFHFGAEADMDRTATIGMSRKEADALDFIVVPINHMHIIGFPEYPVLSDELQARKETYLARWDALLNADLPFHKMGFAHPTWDGSCRRVGAAWENHLALLDSIPDAVFTDYFAKTEAKGMGVELNVELNLYEVGDFDRMLRVYKLAVNAGCRFYMGSDAHSPSALTRAIPWFERWIDLLNLEEEQKFCPFEN